MTDSPKLNTISTNQLAHWALTLGSEGETNVWRFLAYIANSYSFHCWAFWPHSIVLLSSQVFSCFPLCFASSQVDWRHTSKEHDLLGACFRRHFWSKNIEFSAKKKRTFKRFGPLLSSESFLSFIKVPETEITKNCVTYTLSLLPWIYQKTGLRPPTCYQIETQPVVTSIEVPISGQLQICGTVLCKQ